MTGNSSTRVLAVILTHERPEELERCINTALSTLCSQDLLAVLDDSSSEGFRANAALLAKATRGSIARFWHVNADWLHNEVSKVLGCKTARWQLRAARRDIAPLRNLSLLISAAVRSKTTLLIDDDILGFDINCTHQLCEELSSLHEGVIAGGTISGLTDLDTLSRLSNAMRFIVESGLDIPMAIADLFRLPPTEESESAYSGCVSAGYMAFRLAPTNLFAFPPGYNEDWLWSLLYRARGDTCVLKTDQVVQHEPLRLRHPTPEDILFETSGDLILDSILDCLDGGPCMPEKTLQNLSEFAPDLSALPQTRVESIVTQFRDLQQDPEAYVVTDLKDHGLTLLQELLATGELEADSLTTLSTWSADAIAKHRSFAATIENAAVLSTVRQALGEGRR